MKSNVVLVDKTLHHSWQTAGPLSSPSYFLSHASARSLALCGLGDFPREISFFMLATYCKMFRLESPSVAQRF